jgi:hypothetical protein
MKNTLVMTLAGALMAPGLLHAGCSITGGRNPDGSEIPESTATSVAPAVFGYTVLIQSSGMNIPPGASTGILRDASNSINRRVDTLDPTPPSPPPTGGGGNRCDSIRTSMPNSGYATPSYIERTAIAAGLSRHLIELDVTYYQGNSSPVSGERSWWPVASWTLPTGAPYWGSVVRVDYSGWQTGFNWTNPSSLFNVYLNDVLVGGIYSETNKPIVELTWSTDGEVSVILDTGAAPGYLRVEVPIELENPVTENFQPTYFQVGHVYLPYWLRPSYGTVYAYSHLHEGTPTGAP